MIIYRVQLENNYMDTYFDFQDAEPAMEFAQVAVMTANRDQDKKATIIVMEEPKDEEETDSDK